MAAMVPLDEFNGVAGSTKGVAGWEALECFTPSSYPVIMINITIAFNQLPLRFNSLH